MFDSMGIISLQSRTISPSLWSIENEIIAFDVLSWIVKASKTRLKLWKCISSKLSNFSIYHLDLGLNVIPGRVWMSCSFPLFSIFVLSEGSLCSLVVLWRVSTTGPIEKGVDWYYWLQSIRFVRDFMLLLTPFESKMTYKFRRD